MPTSARELSSVATRRSFLRGTFGAAAMLGAAPLLAACGGGDGGGEGGDRLRVAMAGGGDAESLGTLNFRSDMDFTRALALYDPLVVENGGKPVMVLAESVEPERGGRAWTIRLRDGVRFHDGAVATARDALYTLRRIANPKAPGDGAQALAEVDLAASRVLDGRTLRLAMRTPLGDLDAAMGRAYAMVLREGHDAPQDANGTGPFTLASFVPGESTELAPFDDFWRGRPSLGQLQLLSVNDATARLNALRGGQADVDFDLDPVAARRIADGGDRAVRLLRSPDAVYAAAFAMNVTAAPFDDPRVRLAVKLAVDRRELVDKALVGFGEVGNDLSSKGRPSYAADLPQREHDPERARSLLRAAGAEGARVPLLTSAALPAAAAASPLFAEQLRAVGLQVELDEVPPDQYYADIPKLIGAPLKAWGGPVGSVTADLMSFASNAPFNATAWTSKRFDRLLGEARATLDEDRRARMLHDAQEMLWQDGGLVVWGIGQNLLAARPAVHGVEVSAFGRYPTFDRASIQAA